MIQKPVIMATEGFRDMAIDNAPFKRLPRVFSASGPIPLGGVAKSWAQTNSSALILCMVAAEILSLLILGWLPVICDCADATPPDIAVSVLQIKTANIKI